jgi:hypothetical protein
MSKYKFKTQQGGDVSACEAISKSKAWAWIAAVKQLTLEQAKKLYTITKIN